MIAANHQPDRLRAALEELSRRRVFFGHQSVGAEIMQGLAELSGELGVRLTILDAGVPDRPAGPWFAHARIGRNGDPVSKLDAFTRMLLDSPLEEAELALFKLCYVDVTRNTDTAELARTYDHAFSRLRSGRPELAVIAVTVPLTTGYFGVRGRVARVLGLPDPAEPDNRVRSLFNDHLRDRYGAQGTLFDLAAAEAGPARPADGRPPALRPSLTRDGGHLNPRGRRLAAAALVETLGKLL